MSRGPRRQPRGQPDAGRRGHGARVIVAVFLSYQANQGLPFVPTYRVSATLPNAEHPRARQRGPRRRHPRRPDPDIEPIDRGDRDPETGGDGDHDRREGRHGADRGPRSAARRLARSSSAPARPSASKYLDIKRGDSEEGFDAGRDDPDHRRRPPSRSRSTRSSTPSTTPTRAAIQANLTEFGNLLAGRGQSLNAAIGDLRPLVENLEPVMRNLASSETDLAGFVRGLAAAAAEVGARRPAAGPALRQPRDRPSAPSPTSPAPSSRRRSPARRRPRTPRSGALPVVRPLLQATRPASSRTSARASPRCASPRPTTVGGRGRDRRQGAARVAGVQRPARPDGAVAPRLQQRSQRPRGHRRPRRLLRRDTAASVLRRPGAVGLQLRHAPVPKRRQPHLDQRRRPRHLPALHRPRPAERPEQRGQPVERSPTAAATASRPTSSTRTPTRTRPPPARSASARRATRTYIAGQAVIGNVPGNQGILTDGQICEQLGTCKKKKKTKKKGGKS